MSEMPAVDLLKPLLLISCAALADLEEEEAAVGTQLVHQPLTSKYLGSGPHPSRRCCSVLGLKVLFLGRCTRAPCLHDAPHRDLSQTVSPDNNTRKF